LQCRSACICGWVSGHRHRHSLHTCRIYRQRSTCRASSLGAENRSDGSRRSPSRNASNANAMPDAVMLPAPPANKPRHIRSIVNRHAEQQDTPQLPGPQTQAPEVAPMSQQPQTVAGLRTEVRTQQLDVPPAHPALLPDLSPGAVARSCQGRAALSLPDKQGQPVARRERTAEDVQAELNHHLFTEANDVSYARRRDPPKLARRGDGTLWSR
jgi:hypothetical protein